VGSGMGHSMKRKPLPTPVPSWLLKIQKESTTDDNFVTLPSALMDRLGWAIEDFLVWTPQKDGSYKVSKVEKKK